MVSGELEKGEVPVRAPARERSDVRGGRRERSRPQALMRMSTPAGMFRLLRASTVCEVGSEM